MICVNDGEKLEQDHVKIEGMKSFIAHQAVDFELFSFTASDLFV